MPHHLRPHAANALTALRVVLTPVFVVAVSASGGAHTWSAAAVAVFAVVAASDVWDGRLARRAGTDSDAGRTFDHFADILFVLTALSTYAWLGIAPWWVPGAIAASFSFYVVDSWWRNSAGSLVSSRIGHIGGVLNYVLIGVLVCNDTAGIRLLSDATVRRLCWLVPLYSMLAVLTRLAGGGRMAETPMLRATTRPEVR